MYKKLLFQISVLSVALSGLCFGSTLDSQHKERQRSTIYGAPPVSLWNQVLSKEPSLNTVISKDPPFHAIGAVYSINYMGLTWYLSLIDTSGLSTLPQLVVEHSKAASTEVSQWNTTLSVNYTLDSPKKRAEDVVTAKAHADINDGSICRLNPTYTQFICTRPDT